MEIKTEQKMRFVPATCTKCGAALDVDPSQDAAVCPYCDTAFIVAFSNRIYDIHEVDTILRENDLPPFLLSDPD